MSRRRWILTATGAAVALLAVGAVFFATRDRAHCDAFRFDAGEWRSLRPWGDYDDVATGQKFADGIDGCGTLDGLTRPSVKRLLGRPDRTDSAAKEWTYDLGSPYGTSDYSVLVVEFGAGERARGTRVVWSAG